MARKTTKKRTSRKTQEAKEATAKKSAMRRQTAALLIFAGAVLSFCLLIIRGAMLWSALRGLLFGIFGWSAWLLPVFLCYFSIMLAMEKTAAKIHTVLWQCSLLMGMLCSALQIFTADTAGGYWSAIKVAYTAHRGGLIGALIGYPMEYLFSDIGAKIIVCLLVFIFFMLVTRITMMSLFSAVMKPVKKTQETIRQVMEEKGERRRKQREIDVALGKGYVDVEAKEVLPASGTEELEEEPSPKLEAFTKAAQELQIEPDIPAPRLEDILEKVHEEHKKPEPVQEESADTVFAQGSTAAGGDREEYRYPPVSLLELAPPADDTRSGQEIQKNAELLVKTLKDFGVSTKVLDVSRGPSVTRYELEPSAGVKVSRITGLADDLALRLATSGVRIEAPIPNKAAVGIEVPNKVSHTVSLRELLDSTEFVTARSKLTVALGRDIAGKIVLADLGKMPHLLIAGTTGSGKSVCTNAMIQSLLFRNSPAEARLLLIDPKQVEFGVYNGIPHLLVPVVTDPRKAAGALGWAVTEMLNRYKLFAENNVRDLSAYNELAMKSDTLQKLPLIVIVIDELADLMMAAANEVEDAIIRLAQMARAAGMHLVIATQRPSVDVITGLIKANIPSRLALTVASGVDSRTILDTSGAEKLLGRGDMLFMPVGVSKPMRVQGCFVSEREVKAVVDFLKADEKNTYDEQIIQEIDRQAAASGSKGGAKTASGAGDEEGEGDDMLPQAIEVVVEAGMASTSLLQRKLRLGYARAGRIIDELEQRGIVGPHEGSKPRQVLLTRQQWLEMNMRNDE